MTSTINCNFTSNLLRNLNSKMSLKSFGVGISPKRRSPSISCQAIVSRKISQYRNKETARCSQSFWTEEHPNAQTAKFAPLSSVLLFRLRF